MPDRVTADELLEMFREIARRIEGGQRGTVTLKYLLAGDDTEHEHTFSLETEEDRNAALLAIRTVLGQVH